MSFLAVVMGNYLYIFLKAFQSRNVVYLHYWWATFTNFLLVCTEVFVYGNIALTVVGEGLALPLLVVAMSIGGGLGCITSMYLHSTYIGKKDA
jgi:hypothetical protein